MNFIVITSLPDMVREVLRASVIGKASESGAISTCVIDIRDYAGNKHHKIDDIPYGGGPGMVIQATPVLRAHQEAMNTIQGDSPVTLITSPHGVQFDQVAARSWSQEYSDVIIICGRYEGIDQRALDIIQPIEVSVGPFVLTGGELPALVMIDAIARHVPGVLGDQASLEESRIASKKVYTRPEDLTWQDEVYDVPKVLISGHHKNIEDWRREN